jgi:hypothetical protein
MFPQKIIKLITLLFILHSANIHSMRTAIRRLNPTTSSLRNFANPALAPKPTTFSTPSKSPAFARTLSSQSSAFARPLAPATSWRSSEHTYDSKPKSSFNRTKWALATAAVTGSALAYSALQDKEAAHKEAAHAEREIARDNFYRMLEAKPWGEISKKYIQQLQAEEIEIINEFIATLGITPTGFETLKNVIINKIRLSPGSENGKPIPEKHQRLIKSLINSYCPNLHGIELQLLEDMNYDMSVEGAYPKTIISICHDTFEWPLEQFEAGILHEIQHITHNDCCYSTLIGLIINEQQLFRLLSLKKNVDLLKLKEIQTRHDKFQEKRADNLACLVDPKYARAIALMSRQHLKPFVKDSVLVLKISENQKHPSELERFISAKQIYSEISPESDPILLIEPTSVM